MVIVFYSRMIFNSTGISTRVVLYLFHSSSGMIYCSCATCRRVYIQFGPSDASPLLLEIDHAPAVWLIGY